MQNMRVPTQYSSQVPYDVPSIIFKLTSYTLMTTEAHKVYDIYTNILTRVCVK